MIKVLVHKVQEIVLPSPLDDESFEETARQCAQEWKVPVLPRGMSHEEIDAMASLLLGKVPHHFAFDILEDLAQQPALRGELLERVFDVGNDSCRLRICERSDLHQRLEDKCRNLPNVDVDAVRAAYRVRLQEDAEAHAVMGSRVDEHLEISIPNPLDDASFEEASKLWDEAYNATYGLPGAMSPQEIERMVLFLLDKMPATLASSLLSDLAEEAPLRADLLERIFDIGDEWVQVSVCLRSDLDPRLEEKCRNSPYEEVQDHYRARVRRNRQMG